MLPKSYVVFKWAVYAAATLLLCALQSMALNQIRALGLTPFLYPMLPALVAMFEGPRRGAVFALVFGLACGLLTREEFDQLADDIVEEALHIASEHTVEEQVIYKPITELVLA